MSRSNFEQSSRAQGDENLLLTCSIGHCLKSIVSIARFTGVGGRVVQGALDNVILHKTEGV